jgi:hypothetical protein
MAPSNRSGRSGLSSNVARSACGFERGRRGERPLLTSKSVYAFQHGSPGRLTLLSGAVRSVVQLSKQGQAVQPKSLKRTAGAVSSDRGLWPVSLREAAVAFMGRSLSSQTLGVGRLSFSNRDLKRLSR